MASAPEPSPAAFTEEGSIEGEGRYLPLAEYGMIGDSRAAALISRVGSIDWLCWPNFDDPSLFGRLLDYDRGGFFVVRPAGAFRARHRYVGPTSVLETIFETLDGIVRLTDLMPVGTEEQKRHRLLPLRSILRRVEGLEGTVPMELVYSPRPSYGLTVPRPEGRGLHDVFLQVGPQSVHLRSDLPLPVEGADVRLQFTLSAGATHYFGLAYSQDAPAVHPALGADAEEQIAMTLDFWRRWSLGFAYSGPYPEAVLRSALVLKLLAFAPSGAVVAAPTTSLPESPGGTRNWDYRYCWLRDASFTVRALYDLGFKAEGDAFVQWMLHATRLTHPAFQVLYDVYGEARLPERELGHLEGYRGARPVRIGNEAYAQFQIDIYGEVMSTLEDYFLRTGSLDGDTRRLLLGAGNLVARRWVEADHGVWEVRSQRAHHVHGKAMAWLALDCASRIARQAGIRAPVEHWDRAREAIRAAVLSRGYSPRLRSFTRTFDGEELDASLLSLPLICFIPAGDPRMLSTVDAIRRALGQGELIYRYRAEDGLPGREGAFLTCSFWLASALALAGRLEDARATFERLLARSNDLGLLPEEIDPSTGAFLGNFPQGLTHIALINTALTISRAESAFTAAAGRTTPGQPHTARGPG